MLSQDCLPDTGLQARGRLRCPNVPEGREGCKERGGLFKGLMARAKRDPTVAAALGLNWRGRGRLACRLVRDRRVPVCPKLIIPLLALYLASPIDLIPDFIPVIGYLDDLLVLALAAWAFTKLVPSGVASEIARQLADEGYARAGEDDD